MNRSLSVRALLGAVVAMFVAFALLSGATSPAQGDANEGSPVVNPSYRTNAGKISAGDAHTCSIAGSADRVYCWGENYAGQLGDGTTTPSSTPVLVPGLTGVTQVSAGANHTCALLGTGAARCWGGNGNGQLGNGGTTSSSLPVAPAGGNTFTSISAGRVFTCGTTATQVRCWGSNESGQLGNGAFAQRNFPVVAAVPGTPRVVSAGRNQACAVTTLKQLYCWGENSSAQLGLGFTGGPQPSPQQVSSLTGVEAVSTATFHTCALSSAGSGGGTYCWGLGLDGALGNGSTTLQPGPVHPSDPDPDGDRVISAGDAHTCVTDAFFLRCWGSNDRGQLGNGTNATSLVPFRVPGYDGEPPTVTTGYDHTCVRFVSGAVDCWGRNDKGQLGNGTLVDSPTGVHALARPGVPGDVEVRPGDHSLTFSWTPPADGGAPVTGYRLRDLDGAFDVTAPGDATSFTVTGLSEGQSYRPSVSAVNDLGEGQPSTAAPITIGSLPYLEVSDASHAEGNAGSKAMTFTVTRFGKTDPAVSVQVATQDGDPGVPDPATAPSDYTARTATTVSFAAGETTKTFTVTTKGDKLAEDDESFEVVLSSPVGAEIWDGSGVGTLTNDDPGGKPFYQISNAGKAEGDSGTSYLTFTITRGGSTALAGSVKYFTQAVGEATPGVDFTAKAPTGVSFPVGVTSKSVKIAIRGDLAAEPDEVFRVGLSNAVNGSLPSVPYGVGQILNDDSGAPTTIAIGDVSVAEGDGFSKSVTFTITRSGNLAGTTAFKYRTEDGTAVAPGDYTAKALTNLSFAPGQSTRTVAITVKGGAVAEPDEDFFVVLSAATGGSISDGSGRATILDDD